MLMASACFASTTYASDPAARLAELEQQLKSLQREVTTLRTQVRHNTGNLERDTRRSPRTASTVSDTLAAHPIAGDRSRVSSRPASAAFAAVPGTWAGFYVGGNAGYGFSSRTDTTITALDAGAALRNIFITPLLSDSRSGSIYGLQFGINAEWRNLIYGVELDMNHALIEGSESGPPIIVGAGPAYDVTSTETKLDWFGTARLRAGFAPISQSFVYATGGLAFGQVTFSPSIIAHNNGACTLTANICATPSEAKWKTGWALGAGWELAFDEKWSAKLEYLYYDLGRISTPLLPLHNGTKGITWDDATKVTGNIVRVGLNYRFGWPDIGR
jgi:outer membrane immunogenic protein